ncbi:MAG: hypothetical protein QOE45_2853 [Frankiaceae bacterium]|jgi:hypothetical protein|nr:hypothetical protein [Frankiaceae bacterium]
MAEHFFRPAHVVTMVVALCAAAVLAPVAVNAATGSFVNITDPLNAGSKARVTAKGTLWTTETDPLTGTVSRVSSNGRRLVGDGVGPLSVDMAVPGAPLGTTGDIIVDASTTPAKVFSGVGRGKVALTSMVLTADAAAAGSIRVGIVASIKANSASGDCHTGAGFTLLGEQFKVNVVVGTTLNLTWPTPLVWTASADADDFYCINVVAIGGPASYALHVAAYGFTPQ